MLLGGYQMIINHPDDNSGKGILGSHEYFIYEYNGMTRLVGKRIRFLDKKLLCIK
jgi:hypothetical protein